MEPNAQRIAWIDTETTGLDAANGAILEIAIVVTDQHLKVLGSYVSAIYPGADFERLLEPIARGMHERSGLLSEIQARRNALPSVAIAELCAIQVIEQTDAIAAVIAGNSISLDRAFLTAHMPALDALLHYRSIDVSSIKELARMWTDIPELEKRGGHRAYDDIMESIRELQHYRGRFLLG